MGISENLSLLRGEIPQEVRIIVVSKTMPVSDILEAYGSGHREFGENKAQELSEKQKHLPSDIEWHMIGHLQTNKVKLIIPFVHLIHSVDSLKLLSVIDAEAAKSGRRIDCLLQIRIAREETKFGLTPVEAEQLLKSAEYHSFRHIRITGLMGMATFTDDFIQVKSEFSQLAILFERFRSAYFRNDPAFCERSMGMSGDYKLALEAGSTMVRIGSLIFGKRNYNP
jgi:PLP dependent protein